MPFSHPLLERQRRPFAFPGANLAAAIVGVDAVITHGHGFCKVAAVRKVTVGIPEDAAVAREGGVGHAGRRRAALARVAVKARPDVGVDIIRVLVVVPPKVGLEAVVAIDKHVVVRVILGAPCRVGYAYMANLSQSSV